MSALIDDGVQSMRGRWPRPMVVKPIVNNPACAGATSAIGIADATEGPIQ